MPSSVDRIQDSCPAPSYHRPCLIEAVSLNLSSGHGWLLPGEVYSLGTCGVGGASCCRGGNQATTVIVKSPPRWGESGAFILNSTVFTYLLQTQHMQSNFCDEQNQFQLPLLSSHTGTAPVVSDVRQCFTNQTCLLVCYSVWCSVGVVSLGWVTVTIIPSTPNCTLCTCS